MPKTLTEANKKPARAPANRVDRFVIGPGLSARSLEMFTVVASTGSMSAAAAQLGLTQPAISQSMSALETTLGVQLFDRTVRPPVLTLQATGLLRHAAAIVDSLKRFDRALQFGELAQLPLLKIGMLNSVVTTMGPQIIRLVRGMVSEVFVDTSLAATGYQALTSRDVDLIITASDAIAPPEVDSIRFITEPLLVVAPQSHSSELGDIAALNVDLDFIRFGRTVDRLRQMDQALNALGVTPKVHYHLDTSEAALQMVADGYGWSILPLLVVVAAIQRATPIRAAPFPSEGMTRTLKIAWRKDEGRHIAEQVHAVGIATFRETMLPTVKAEFPTLASKVVLHD